jgi:hypothetical protein
MAGVWVHTGSRPFRGAEKTMFGRTPAKKLVSPPFEVKIYLNQNIQAADWMAAIINRLWCFELQPEQYTEYSKFKDYFWARVHGITTHSTVVKRQPFKIYPPSTKARTPISIELTPVDR